MTSAYESPTHPFEVGVGQGAKQADENHGDVREQDPKGVAQWDGRHQQQVEQQQGRRAEPICDKPRVSSNASATICHVCCDVTAITAGSAAINMQSSVHAKQDYRRDDVL